MADARRPVPSRLVRRTVMALGGWLLLASPSYAFIWGEPLPLLPPVPTQGPPPTVNTNPPDNTGTEPPTTDVGIQIEPPAAPPADISATPEPASIVAGLIGAGALGAIGAWRRRRQRA